MPGFARSRFVKVAAAAMLLAPALAGAANNCSSFADLRGRDPVIVRTIAGRYSPACARVSLGTTVRFESGFASHPLYGGIVADGVASIDPASPIGPWTSGTLASVVLPAPGEYPYFCDFHFDAGMLGSVQVDAVWFGDGFE